MIEELGDDIHQVLFKNSIVIAVEKNSVFTFFNKVQIENLVTSMEFHDYEENDVVFKAGSVIGL